MERLERAFETWWPQLEKALEEIPEATEKAPPSRTDRDILEEVLRLIRLISRQSALILELEEETIRNRVVHGLPFASVESTEDGDLSNQSRTIEAAHLFSEEFRRLRGRRKRKSDEREDFRRALQILADSSASPGSEVQTNKDADGE